MKKYLFIFVPALLVGCGDNNLQTSSEEVSTKPVEQTVYQWSSVQASSQAQQFVEKSSDEYWQTVSGKELKKGVSVYLTTNDNLIRVAPKATYDNGQVFKAAGVEIQDLELLDSTSKIKYDLSPTATQSQMKLAGFDDGSVAIKGLTNGQNAILKTRQPLADHELYLIHVKEKNTPHVLNIKSGFKKLNNDNRLSFNLDMPSGTIASQDVSLSLISPVSEQVDVSLSNGGVEFSQPLEQLGAINGFYELDALVLADINGKKVMRSVKVPFTNVKETASLGQPRFKQAAGRVLVDMPIEADMPGRYAVKATLATRDGDTVTKLATIEVAAHIDSYADLSLPFNVNLVGAKKVFLTDVEVTDQTRMIKTYPKL
ncbi:hypothetical protein GCM10009128_11590 [Psychrosphaera haliotis]|uniref:DUF4785 domain-containing protein n=1 Tax=Psychrosphaera haliotis TaxID=555083 RepID=UPI0031D6CE2F